MVKFRGAKKIKEPGRFSGKRSVLLAKKEREEDEANMVLAGMRKRRESSDEDSEELDDWGDEDFMDNLTYHEDSLSIMKGVVSTPAGENIPIWVTTDSGSMTQLIQTDFAKGLKLPIKKIPGKRCFSISSPGGGSDFVEEYVSLPLRIKCKRETSAGQPYGENTSPEVEKEVNMRFGLCDSLPVPVLWGGRQMRKYNLVDYHKNKVLSI